MLLQVVNKTNRDATGDAWAWSREGMMAGLLMLIGQWRKQTSDEAVNLFQAMGRYFHWRPGPAAIGSLAA